MLFLTRLRLLGRNVLTIFTTRIMCLLETAPLALMCFQREPALVDALTPFRRIGLEMMDIATLQTEIIQGGVLTPFLECLEVFHDLAGMEPVAIPTVLLPEPMITLGGVEIILLGELIITDIEEGIFRIMITTRLALEVATLRVTSMNAELNVDTREVMTLFLRPPELDGMQITLGSRRELDLVEVGARMGDGSRTEA